MPRDTGFFKIKERVLVAYTDKHYEAKVRSVVPPLGYNTAAGSRAVFCFSCRGSEQVVKAEKRDGLWYYFIHYPVCQLDVPFPLPLLTPKTQSC